MKLFNAATVIAIAAALPSTTSATLRRAPTNNYEERKLQDEVGSMPIDAIEPMDDHGGFIFDKIFDAKCELAAELIDERLDLACDNAAAIGSKLRCAVRRRLNGDVPQGDDDPVEGPCDELCDELDDFIFDYCITRDDHPGRKLKDTSSVMQIDEGQRKLQDMEVMALGSVAMEEAVKSLDALDILGEKIFEFKCDLAADLVEERLDLACNNVGDFLGSSLGASCVNRRLDSHGSHGHGGLGLGVCRELCDVLVDFLDNYCMQRDLL